MRTLAAAGPTLKVSGWVSWILLVGSVCTAGVAIWKAAVPVIRAIARVNEAIPVLMEMATDFRSNHGSSLKDRIERTDDNVDALGMVNIDGKTLPLGAVVADLHTYAHDNNHLLRGRVTAVEGWQQLYQGMLAKIPDPVGSSS